VPVVAGRIVRLDDVIEGWLRFEHGKIVEVGEGASEEKPVATGWIVPAPINAHTHLGDTALRDLPGKPHGLAELVGPGGWKHAQLAKLERRNKQDGIRRALHEMTAVGTQAFVDFREMGAAGADVLREVAEDHAHVEPRILGRPENGSDEALEAALAACDGLGIPALADVGWGEAERWAEAAHTRKKSLAMHVSEGRREEMQHALALEPDFLVHACQATRADLDAVAGEETPIVVCPRSNRFFGLKAPVPLMLQSGIAVALGTDNGMLHDANVLEEAKLLHATQPAIAVADILRMATHHGRKVAALPAMKFKKGEAADVVVLPDRVLDGGNAGKPGFLV
jgi:cytosine/adenosine deaminase-related metal-dependent hydrolase